MRDLESRTRSTAVLKSRVMTAFCFASSQMTTLFCEYLGFLPPPTSARKLYLPSISVTPIPALKSLDTLSSHGSELKTQKPVSRPTQKQLASWLKDADKEMGPAESSITGLVFIVKFEYAPVHAVKGAAVPLEVEGAHQGRYRVGFGLFTETDRMHHHTGS